jgi:uncharacterized protein YkwD
MPLKTSNRQPHHVAHKKEKRTKHFLKVYAPYIPLMVIVGCGLFLSLSQEFRSPGSNVKSYATDITDQGLLDATNRMRAQDGIPALNFNGTLDQAAQAKANDMKQNNYWSHVTPDGRTPWDFIKNTDYQYKKAAENLAYGFATSNTTVKGWMNSPGHRANLLDPALRDVGFGIVNIPNYQGKGPETVVVAIYGQPSTLGAATPLKPAAQNPPSFASEPENISYIQSLTSGKAPWVSFAIGLLIGVIIMYLTLKHAHGIRKSLKKGEKFVLHHPLLDITLIALAALAVIVSQTIGTIY